MTNEERGELEGDLRELQRGLGRLATFIPADSDVFREAGWWDLDPHGLLRAIYEQLSDQQAVIQKLARHILVG